MNGHTVDSLKAASKFFAAGALARALGMPNDYGCHFGMISGRAFAKSEFSRGWISAESAGANKAVMASDIAHDNARFAVDGLGRDSGGTDPVSDYAQNVRDTLKELGLREFTREALKAYYLTVSELL